jgi:hypothetical protein
MKRASLLSPKESRSAHSRLTRAIKLTTTRIALVSMILAGLVTLSLLYMTRPAHAAAITSAASGNWNSTGTWVGGAVPTSGDTVTIAGGHTVTVDIATAACASLVLNSSSNNATATLNFVSGGTGQLTVGGSVTVGNGGGSSRAGVLTMANGGTLKVGTAFTLTVGQSIFTPGSGTVDYNGTAQTVTATTYNNLTLSGSGAKTMTGVGTVNSNFTLSGTSSTTGVSVDMTIGGNVTIGTGTTFAAGTSRTHNVAGNWTNDGAFSFTTPNTINFNGNNALQTISGNTSTAFNAITVNKGTLVSNTLEATGPMSMTGQTTITNGTFKLTHASASGQFNGASTITLPSTAGLWINGGSWTTTGIPIVTTSGSLIRCSSGTLTLANGAGNRLEIVSGATLTMEGGTLNIGGRLFNNGGSATFSGGTTNLSTVGLSASGSAIFEMTPASNLTMTSGAPVLTFQNANGTAPGSATTGGDLLIRSGGTKSITAGTFQLGNASTPGGQVFLINSEVSISNLAVNGTNSPTARLRTNALTLSGGVTLASGGTLDAATNNLNMTVGGDWTNNSNAAAFAPGTATVTFNNTGAAQFINGTATSQTFNSLTVTKTAQTLTIGGSATLLTVNGALTVTSGIFDQGASSDLSMGSAGSISVAVAGTLKNLGTGDLTVGSGGVANAGTINYNSGGSACGDAKSILIRSSANGTQRSWTGAGTFTMSDLDVKDQAGTAIIAVKNGTNSGNNGVNWLFIGCTGGSYTWTPTVTGDWQIALNWTPTRTTPDPGDLLTVNGATTPSPIITNVPTQTIAGLRLINTATPTLQTSAANVLTINGGAGSDLSIPTGTALKLTGANGLTLSIASGSTGNVAGDMLFQDGAHRLIGNAQSAVTLQHFFTTASGFSGNAFGTGGAGDGAPLSIIFASGSTYFHNAGSSPFGTTGNTVAVFQSGSEADYLTATGFDANGRTYANLVIGNGSTAVSVSDSGSGNFQFDNLAINNTGSADSSITYSGSGASTITIRGNITSVGAGSGNTLPDVSFTAAGGIVIDRSSPGTVTFGQALNSRFMQFESSTTINSGTTLALSRKLLLGMIQPNNSLFMTVNGGLTGSASGYLIGNEKRPYTAPATFTYHVGTINAYSPMDANVTAGTGDLTVAAVQGTQPLLTPATSLKRYWRLTEGGSITADMTFHYKDPLDIMGNESDYRIIAVDGSNATSFPNNCPSGDACVDTAGNTATIKSISDFSDWTLGAPAAPTAVKLRSFTATQSNNNEVTLHWQTGHEVRNLGYYVYREQNGQRTLITPSIVAGSALIAGRNTVMTAGMSYTWYDQPQASGVTYWIEDVDLDGTRTLHGPIAPALSYDLPNAAAITYGSGNPQSTDGQTPNQGVEKGSELLSEVQKHAPGSGSYFREWPAVFASQHAALIKAPESGSNRKGGPDAAQAQSQAAQEQIGGMSGIKIAVSRSGWQRISQPELVAAGLDPNVSAQKLQLYANGSAVPIRLSGNGLTLTATDYIEFYGHGLESPTDLGQTYYLVVGKGPGSRILDVKKAPALLPPSGPSSFDYTVERKDKYLYYAALLNGEKENIFGHIVTSSPVDETLPISNRDPIAAAAGAQAHLEVSLVGVSLQAHLVRVSVNGTEVGTIDFNGAENPSRTFAMPAGLLFDGDNTVRFNSVSTDRDVSLVETVRLTYPHSFKADNNSLAIGVNSAATTRVSGFTSSNIRVVDITNQSTMSDLTQTITVRPQTDGTFAADIQVPTATLSSPHTLLVFAGGQALHPDLVKRNDPSSWATQKTGFDYLIITSRDFKANVEPLAQLRRNQGLTVAVVDIEDLYDEFSFGLHSPQAVHDFLQSAVNNWSRKPRYVLLAGDASYDPKNYLGQGSTDFVPTRLFDSALMETASDDWLADFDGDGVADMAIGRLPLRTAADADLMVNKIISYEGMTPDPQRKVILVADYSFEGSSSAVQGLVPAAVPVLVINRSSSDDGTIHTQIVNGINQGPRLVNYVGHGSIGVWTGAPVLSTDDTPSLTNNSRLSVFVMMTCMNGYFENAYDDSLSEALLRNPGGAVAVWASTGLTEPPGQDLIDQEFYRQLFGGTQPTLGYAVLNAKHATADSDVRRTWILFGDPAMRLK